MSKTITAFSFALLFLFAGIRVQAQCSASFTVTDSGGIAFFTNTSTGFSPMLGGSVGNWTFGDGSSGTTSGMNGTTHFYNSPGPWVVCLTMTDSLTSCTSTYCDSVYLGGGGGVWCNAYYTSSTTGCTVNFTDGSSGSGTVTGHSWTFGDGGTSTLASPSHTYASSGSYYVCHSITTSDGCTNNYCGYEYPSCGNPCQASFVWAHDSTGAFTILLWNTSNFGAPASTSYLWTFGDGTSSTNPYPSHVYAGAGTYVVCLTMTDTNCTSTYCDSIPVTFKTNTPFSINVVGGMTSVNPVKPLADLTAFPNPFDASLTLNFNLSSSSDVVVTLTDLTGRTLLTQVERNVPAGNVNRSLSTGELPAGVYMMHLSAGEQTLVKKVIAE